jgi:hypothetical protein
MPCRWRDFYLYWVMYLNMLAGLLVVAVLTSLLYTTEESTSGEADPMASAAGAAGAELAAPKDESLMEDYEGNVVVTEHGSPMLKSVQESLQKADAVMLKQNEIHRELIDQAGQ